MPKIEYIMVADHAEVLNGKLYAHGAGWTDLAQPLGPDGQPGINHLGIAASVMVGWNETNRRFPFLIRLLHEDGMEMFKIEAQMEAGRPPGIPLGSDFRSLMAVSAEIKFPQPGRYELRAELDGAGEGTDIRSVSFRVNPAIRMMPGPQAAAS